MVIELAYCTLVTLDSKNMCEPSPYRDTNTELHTKYNPQLLPKAGIDE